MIVHILLEGAAFCGIPGVPREWPEGHRWVDLRGLRHANCEACLREFELAQKEGDVPR